MMELFQTDAETLRTVWLFFFCFFSYSALENISKDDLNIRMLITQNRALIPTCTAALKKYLKSTRTSRKQTTNKWEKENMEQQNRDGSETKRERKKNKTNDEGR